MKRNENDGRKVVDELHTMDGRSAGDKVKKNFENTQSRI